MIQAIKAAIKDKLLELYPQSTVYDEDLPGEYEKPSFLLTVKSQSYVKRLQGKYKNQVTFDISYYSNLSDSIKTDCLDTGVNLLSEFDLIGSFRVINKKAETTDNVLHFTFDIHYSVMEKETSTTKMQNQELKTNL